MSSRISRSAGHVQFNHVQAVIQILPKLPGLNTMAEFFVCGADNTHINTFSCDSQSFLPVSPDDPKQFNLHG